MSKIQKATHQGELKLGDTVPNLLCAVLEDGTRVISKSAVFKALGRTKRGRIKGEVRVHNMPELPSFIDANNLQPFINEELKRVLKGVEYLNKKSIPNSGYEATILPLLCDVYLEARKNGKLTKQQLPIAEQSEILVRSLSKVGIIALVDEATGYQYDRERDELQKILKAYISEELLAWGKRFPDEFYREIFRLNDWVFTPSQITSRPGIIGTWTKRYIYSVLPKGVLQALLDKTERNDKGKLKTHLHRHLTREQGIEHLNKQIIITVGFMNISDNWKQFEQIWNKKFGQQELFNNELLEPKKEKPKPLPILSEFNTKLQTALKFNPKNKE